MLYYISEGENEQKFNATSKARQDVEKILEYEKYKKVIVPTKYKRESNIISKIKQIRFLSSNYKIWKNTISKFSKEDVVIIQYPVLNSLIGLNKILKQCKKNGIKTILLIHDMDSLRNSKKNIILKEDYKNFKEAGKIIAHNEKMKDKIIEMGIESDKIIVLNIFDYIYDTVEFKNLEKSKNIIIAGNLSKIKSKYIGELYKLNTLKFNLYGVGYEKQEKDSNVNYKGKFTPEELINKLEGSFGLIWDGNSIETCNGISGNYLKYNNPHKTSLYLAAGIPVIVWSNSAMAKFVIDNNVGFAVNNLNEIDKIINEMSLEKYQDMVDNSRKISSKLKDGEYLKMALSNNLK